MSEKQKQFSAGVILTSLFAALVVGISTWVTIRASEVPILQAQMQEMNKQLSRMNSNLDGFNEFIEEHHHDKILWSVWKTETDIKLQVHDHKIQRNDMDIEGIAIKCDINERGIAECEEIVKKDS